MTGLVYAPGALLAAARGDAALWHLHRAALLRGQTPLVPAPVLAAITLPPAGGTDSAGGRDSAGGTAGARATAGTAGADGGPGQSDAASEGSVRRLAALLAGCALVDFPGPAAWDVLRLRRLAPDADPVAAAVVLAALASRAVVVHDAAQPYREIAARLGVTLDVAIVTSG